MVQPMVWTVFRAQLWTRRTCHVLSRLSVPKAASCAPLVATLTLRRPASLQLPCSLSSRPSTHHHLPPPGTSILSVAIHNESAKATMWLPVQDFGARRNSGADMTEPPFLAREGPRRGAAVFRKLHRHFEKKQAPGRKVALFCLFSATFLHCNFSPFWKRGASGFLNSARRWPFGPAGSWTARGKERRQLRGSPGAQGALGSPGLLEALGPRQRAIWRRRPWLVVRALGP